MKHAGKGNLLQTLHDFVLDSLPLCPAIGWCALPQAAMSCHRLPCHRCFVLPEVATPPPFLVPSCGSIHLWFYPMVPSCGSILTCGSIPVVLSCGSILWFHAVVLY